MNHSISLAELVGKGPFSFEGMEAMMEVHATLLARYEEKAGEVVAELDAYLCPDDASRMMTDQVRPDWLPGKQVVRVGGEGVETSDIARDVFHSWVKRVRGAAKLD